ncbi:MAG: hypothetical protein ABR538_01505 [Candidatus Binatia bacterium]
MGRIKMNKMKRFATRTGGVVAAALAVAVTWASGAQAADCLAAAYGGSLNCTSNDFTVSSVTVTNVDLNDCGGGSNTFTFDGTLNVGSGTTDRYDVGFYISNNSSNADVGGTCTVAVIPPGSGTADDGDQCGDYDGSAASYPVSNLTVTCQDADGDGFFDFSICSAWAQNDQSTCNGPDDAVPGTSAKCECTTVNSDVQIPQCDTNADCAADANQCTDAVCLGIGEPGADTFGCAQVNRTGACDDGLFCTQNDTCNAGVCSGTSRNCADAVDCTADSCNETTNQCDNIPNNGLCNDGEACTSDICSVAQGGCVNDFICGVDICRSPGFWSTHSGYEKSGSVNVGQLLIDLAGPFEVCGETISTTSNGSSPYVSGLGLTSNLEGLCMRGQGVKQRQLYRQLVAAKFNCEASGASDCDSIVNKYIDIAWSDCSDVCAGNPPADPPSVGECISQLDCFNNGGQVVEGQCAKGTCESQPHLYCGEDYGSCPDFDALPQACVNFPGNCHDTPLCNEGLGFCPKSGPASSPKACREARHNGCTIDSCN